MGWVSRRPAERENMKIIALGGSGMTGYYLPQEIPNFDLENGYDITNKSTLQQIFEREKPDAVLHLAAITDVVGAENDYLHCYSVNTIGSYLIARLCKKYKAQMCFISSVDVFDGKKSAPYIPDNKPNPIVEYGHSKFAAETLIKSILPDALIIRAGWMFGGVEKDKKFVSYIVNQIRDGKPQIKAVNDVIGSATYGKDLIQVAIDFLDNAISGTAHICNSGIATRYEEAKIIAEELGYTGEVIPVSMEEFPNFRALKNATMVPSIPMRSWQDALKEYMQEFKNV